MNHKFQTGIDFAEMLDRVDLLKEFRQKFVISEDVIYLDGNSLGRLPKVSAEQLNFTIQKEWGDDLIESWNKSWYSKPLELGNKIASIIGASEGEVVVCDSTSVNLYKLIFAALKYQTGKTKVVSDVFNFPTDLYILQGILKNFRDNYELALTASNDGISINTGEIDSLIDKNTALVVLSHVAFKSAFKYEMKEITRLAHQKGAMVIWDLSHSGGVAEIRLNEWDVDMAVGCTYKFMNGGPGSPAFLYVKNEWQEKLFSPVQGWFGESNPFAFDLNYQPARGIRKFLGGTPPVLNLMAIEPAIDIIIEAGINNIAEKSAKQTEYLLFLIREILLPLGFKIGSPESPGKRGSHISIRHNEAFRICQALINPVKSVTRVIPDFREPDNIRLGISPLYTSFEEIYHSVQRINTIVENSEFMNFSNIRNKVT